MMDGFTGRAFLVTGASGGIGRTLSIELAARGGAVALAGRNQEALEATRSRLVGEGHLILRCDLADLGRLPGLVERLLEWREPVDGFAHCAGVAGRSRLRDTTPETLAARMDINCFAFVELLRGLVTRKKKEHSLQAVAISSLAALGHDRYMTAYAASKAALEAAAKTLAVELLPRKVRINLVRCAFVDTAMATGGDLYGDFDAQIRENGYQPLGLIPPSAVADMAALLLGPGGAYCTGQVFTINAGARE